MSECQELYMLDVHLLMGKKAVVSAERVRRSGRVVFFLFLLSVYEIF